MILCIINQCNRDCDYCFEGRFKKGPKRIMSLDDVRRICEFTHFSRTPGAAVNVMGGEPTLHPQLREIMTFLRQSNRTADVVLLTNLLCRQSVLEGLAGLSLRCLANVGGYPQYSAEERDLLHANLAFLRTHRIFRSLGLAVTIAEADDDFGFLYDILEQDEPDGAIGGIRIGISCPGMDFKNRFPTDFSLAHGEKYAEIVEQCHRIKPLIAFRNECPVNMCMMSEALVTKLAPAVEHLVGPCGGNFDILPGFSTHWCFAFEGIPEMCVENIFDYRDMEEVGEALRRKAYDLERSLDMQCEAGACEVLRCIGPCAAIRYYRQHLPSGTGSS